MDLGNMYNSFRCKLKIQDQKNICSEIAQIPETSFINEIKKYGIILTDRVTKNTDLLYDYSHVEIRVLICADVAEQLFTEDLKKYREDCFVLKLVSVATLWVKETIMKLRH